MVELRRELHRHPELAFEEYQDDRAGRRAARGRRHRYHPPAGQRAHRRHRARRRGIPGRPAGRHGRATGDRAHEPLVFVRGARGGARLRARRPCRRVPRCRARVATPASASRSACVASASPAPRHAATWTSCPQACATPGTADEYDRLVRSVTGSASMSARRATRYAASPGPMSAMSPLPGRRVIPMPASASRPPTRSVVLVSSNASSGCRCNSRRSSTIVGNRASTWPSTEPSAKEGVTKSQV